MKAVKSLSVLCLAATSILWLIALWTVGPDAAKYGWTGLLTFGVGAVLVGVWTMP